MLFTQGQGGHRPDADPIGADRTPPGRVPGYEILELIGEGTYGEVWKARCTGAVDRLAAIKFCTRGGRGESVRVADEYRKMLMLDSDRYVVQIFDADPEADPPHFVMEYLQNGSLQDRLDAGGPPPVDEAVELFKDVVVGLVHMHNMGLFHCDLKPANILLDNDGRPRLTDFGQARRADEESSALGTLFYMAPEQARPEERIDAGWDVYALGAVLHAMLTGAPPHADSPWAARVREAPRVVEKLRLYAEGVSSAPVPKVRGIDRPLAEILERCLHPRPSKRYPNPQAVRDALEGRAERRAGKPFRALAAIGGALALLLGLALAAWLAVEEAVRSSKDALSEASQANMEAMARLAADRVFENVELRWQALRRIAADPEFQGRLAAASKAGPGSVEQGGLQRFLEDAHRQHAEFDSYNWSAFDRGGVQLAVSLIGEYSEDFEEYRRKGIGEDRWFRDYFHGLGEDLDRDRSPGPRPEPIREPHCSILFRGISTGEIQLQLSVPVWDGPPTTPDHPRLGVLSMTINAESFGDFLPRKNQDEDPVAFLVDRHKDWEGEKNRILYHPDLDDEPKPYLSAGMIRPWMPHFDDPLGGADVRSRGGWVAASCEVEFAGAGRGPTSPADQGAGRRPWVVLVEQRQEVVFGPVDTVHRSLWRFFVPGMIGVGLVLASLSGFLLLASGGTTRSRWQRFLRRRAGLSSQSGLGPSSRPSATAEGRRGGPRPSTRRPSPTQPGTAAFPSVAVPWTIAASLARTIGRPREDDETPGGLASPISPEPGRSAGVTLRGRDVGDMTEGVSSRRDRPSSAPPTL